MLRSEPLCEKKDPWPFSWVEKCRPLAAFLVLACGVGAWFVWLHWNAQSWSDLAVELGGPARFLHLGTQMAGRLRTAAAGWWRPAIGLCLLAAGGLLGRIVSPGPQARRVSVAAAWTLIALAGVHCAENWLLLRAVRAAPAGHHLNAYALWLQGVAFLGDALLPVAGLIAVLGAITALARLLFPFIAWLRGEPGKRPGPEEPSSDEQKTSSNGDVLKDSDQAYWHQNMQLPGDRQYADEGLGHPGLGICLSGGGIRSASFALGALQELQREDMPGIFNPVNSELMRAKYIAAVSGGSYIAGAFLLAVHKKEEKCVVHNVKGCGGR